MLVNATKNITTKPADREKTKLATSLALILGTVTTSALLGTISTSAVAALQTDSLLNFDPGVTGGNYGFVTGGSYFAMGTTNPPDRTPIVKNDGLIIGTVQPATGSHGGLPDGSESPGIDLPWGFFGNTGMHLTEETPVTATDVNATTQALDMSGWRVTWNTIDSINMGGGQQDCGTSTDGICVDSNNIDIAGTYDNGSSIGTLVCGVDCSDGDTFTLDYQAVVPQADPSNFGGVAYFLRMTGTIVLQGSITANDDTATTITDNSRVVPVTDNDVVGSEGFEPSSVTITTPAGSGTAVANADADNTATYTPNAAFTGTDTFQYTVASTLGATSNPATVTVDVQTNQSPVASDDAGSTSTAILDSTPLTIDVLSNDTDANNSPGLPGGIDVTTVAVTNAAGNTGTCTANADGTITYSQSQPSVGATDACTYTVTDIDSAATPLTSNLATVTINVEETTSDWPAVLDPDIIPVLNLTPGADNPDQSVKPEGSWFSMQVSASQLIYTSIEPGPDGGFVIGYDQAATGSHTGSPNGTEQTAYTDPWVFFSNTGFDLTRNGGIEGNNDGTLDFRTKYFITWNGIAAINLGGSTDFPEDLGFATIQCSDKPCQHGSSYTLEYAAHVQDIEGEESSGFDKVAYQLFQEGTVSFLDGNLKVNIGTVTNQTRLAASEVPSDDGVDLQCVGSCFDYTVENVTNPSVAIVLPQAGGVPNSPVWRILENDVWRDFDTTVDTVRSAPAVEGVDGLECPEPGDSAYIDLAPDTDANVGHQCIQLTILDNGLNDLNPAGGIISDPGGLGTAGVPEFEDRRTSDTSGCSIAATPVNPARRGDWWLLAALISLLGWLRKQRPTAEKS